MSSATPTAQMMQIPRFVQIDRRGVALRAPDPNLAARRKAKAEVELLALEYQKIMLERHISEALDPKTDPRLRRDLRNDVLNRGIGKVTEQPDEDTQKKSDSAGAFLEALASISRAASANEQAQRALGHTPKDVTPTDPVSDLEGFFIEVDNEDSNHEQ